MAMVALFLGGWACISAISTPVVVLLLRRRGRANARLTAQLRREGWASESESAPGPSDRMLAG